MSIDLGSLGPEVSKRGAAGLGEEAWSRHMETVSGFWRSLAEYFKTVEAAGLKIYQDGMMAEGELAGKIVREGAQKGSKNYEIVLGLINRGAALIRTEDFGLLKKEYDLLVEISSSTGALKKFLSYLKYRAVKNGILKERDRFIAGRINETLKNGEKGVLFLGAYHDVYPYLSGEIEVIEIKDRQKVREYQEKFFYRPRYAKEIEELSRYLISPVDAMFAD